MFVRSADLRHAARNLIDGYKNGNFLQQPLHPRTASRKGRKPQFTPEFNTLVRQFRRAFDIAKANLGPNMPTGDDDVASTPKGQEISGALNQSISYKQVRYGSKSRGSGTERKHGSYRHLHGGPVSDCQRS